MLGTRKRVVFTGSCTEHHGTERRVFGQYSALTSIQGLTQRVIHTQYFSEGFALIPRLRVPSHRHTREPRAPSTPFEPRTVKNCIADMAR